MCGPLRPFRAARLLSNPSMGLKQAPGAQQRLDTGATAARCRAGVPAAGRSPLSGRRQPGALHASRAGGTGTVIAGRACSRAGRCRAERRPAAHRALRVRQACSAGAGARMVRVLEGRVSALPWRAGGGRGAERGVRERHRHVRTAADADAPRACAARRAPRPPRARTPSRRAAARRDRRCRPRAPGRRAPPQVRQSARLSRARAARRVRRAQGLGRAGVRAHIPLRAQGALVPHRRRPHVQLGLRRAHCCSVVFYTAPARPGMPRCARRACKASAPRLPVSRRGARPGRVSDARGGASAARGPPGGAAARPGPAGRGRRARTPPQAGLAGRHGVPPSPSCQRAAG